MEKLLVDKYRPDMSIRQLLICSVLSEQPLNIEDIRADEPNQGLHEYEIKLIQLIEQMTNGTKAIISQKGKSLRFYPGIITNNNEMTIEFDCGLSRNISYYIESILPIGLFGKSNLRIQFQGITNDDIDLSIEAISNGLFPLLKNFGLEVLPTLKIIKKGFKPYGGGQVNFSCPFVKYIRPINLINSGKIKRVRGYCYGSKVNPQFLNSTISAARSILNEYIPDVWIHSDLYKGPKAGNSQSYGITLIAESTTGCLITAEDNYDINAAQSDNNPESIGQRVALKLLDEILYSGVADTHFQGILLLLMAISDRKISKIKLGRISAYTINLLRLIKKFFGISFSISEVNESNNIEEEEENENNFENDKIIEEHVPPSYVMFSCIGAGLVNISRKVL